MRKWLPFFVTLSVLFTLPAHSDPAQAAACANLVTSISTKNTQYEPQKQQIRYADSMMRDREYTCAVVKPVENGDQLNNWAFRHFTDGQTQLGVIRLADNVGKDQPSFAAGFEPQRNMIVLVENESGVNNFLYKHEERHLLFDRDLRQGKATVFAGFGIQTYEELYTYPHDLVAIPPAERLRLIDYVEQRILPISQRVFGDTSPTILHSVALRDMRDHLSGSAKFELAPSYSEPSNGLFRPYMNPTPWIWSTEPGGMALLVSGLTIHDRAFIGVTLKYKNYLPISLVIAARDAGSFFKLSMEVSQQAWSGPRARELINLVLQRLEGLAHITAAMEEQFAQIRMAIAQGGSGDENARKLLDIVEPYRTQIEPAF